MGIREKAMQNTLSDFDKLLEIQKVRDGGKFYSEEVITEAKKDEDAEKNNDASIIPDAPDADDKGKKDKKEKDDKEDEGKDAMDKADDVLKNIDLKQIDNDGKIELIESIIDALQNDCETDDDFSEYMNKVLDIIDGYKFDKEGEEEAEEEKEDKKEEKEDKKKEEKEDKEEKPEDEKKKGKKDAGMELELGEV